MRVDVVGGYLCDDKEEKKFRTRFGRNPGVSVRGWPSKGGIYILERCFNIELDFLKLDKFHDTPQPSPSDLNEEAHCNRSKYNVIFLLVLELIHVLFSFPFLNTEIS